MSRAQAVLRPAEDTQGSAGASTLPCQQSARGALGGSGREEWGELSEGLPLLCSAPN